MTDDSKDYSFLKRLKTVKPQSLGWLHRPELERPGENEQIWELPDGRLQSFFGKKRKVRIAMIDGKVTGPSWFDSDD